MSSLLSLCAKHKIFGSCSICFQKVLLRFLQSAEHSIKAEKESVCHDPNSNENLMILISFLTCKLGEARLSPCPGCHKAEDGADSGQCSSVHSATDTASPVRWRLPEMTLGLVLVHIIYLWRSRNLPITQMWAPFHFLSSDTIKPFLLNISGGQLTSENIWRLFLEIKCWEMCLFLTKNKLFWTSGRWHRY